ncbi:hypothetical protein BG011_001338 [Mortierella polycephala]|uniref:Uncharacterized protein n=1 Tax=Mortierella polycephala TaxID=41804 RepID=A0A9P6PLH1_9FUNG|nr:hypothetical protein BG011_001338 [Mortierella polycephala]
MDIVRKEFHATRTCLIEHGGALKFFDDTKLLAIYDEAQILGEESSGRFESMNGAKVDRPLLSPILYGFRNIEGANKLTLLTSGTGLNIFTRNWAQRPGSILKHERDAFYYLEFPGWTGRESAIELLLKKLVDRFRPIVNVNREDYWERQARMLATDYRGH